MNTIIFQDNNYLLTANEFTYKGTKEPIQNVKGLRIIESNNRKKLINGSVGALIALATTLFFIPMLSVLATYDLIPLFAVQFLIPAIATLVGFSVFYMRTKKFSLEIVKSTGNKGIIDKSDSKEFFEKLIKTFYKTKDNFNEKYHLAS